MAHVAGVSQLMETVVPATQTPSSTPAPEHSFATVMRQARTDVGTPVAPIEQKTPVKQNDPGGAEDKKGETGPTQVSAQAEPVAADPTKVVSAAAMPQPSLRYTPASMLSAILAHTGNGAASNSAAVADLAVATPQASSIGTPLPQPSSNVKPLSAVPAVVAAPTPNGNQPMPVATLDSKAVDLSASAPTQASKIPDSIKPASKAGASTGQTPVRSSTKAEATKAPEETAVSILTAVSPAPTPVSMPLPQPTPTAADAGAPMAAPAVAATSVKAPAATSTAAGTNAAVGRAVPLATSLAAKAPSPSMAASGFSEPPPQAPQLVTQPSAATFKQSLAVSSTQSAASAAIVATAADTAAAPAATAHSLPAAFNKHPESAAAQANIATTIVPPAASAFPPTAATLPAVPVAQPGSTQPLPGVAIPAAAAAPAPLPPPQTAVAHKTAGKPSLIANASQPTVAAVFPAATPTPAQTTNQPSASGSASSGDGKPAPHSPAAAVIVPAPAVDPLASTAVPFAVAHTPVAVTALNNSNGPALTAVPVIAATSTTMTDSPQHTTLTSTPTTLEVGVASGTHGWLKIRAELNASGTVDASLTGTNAAATGKLHNDLPALSSFLQDERVAFGSLNVSAPGATASALHATVASTLEPVSSFTRSAAEGVGATGTAVASDTGASGGRAPQQQAPEGSPRVADARAEDGVAGAITTPASPVYGERNDLGDSGTLSPGGYGGGGSWLNVRV